MNENIDLTKILEGCPSGTEFYNSVYGKVKFIGVDFSNKQPIVVRTNDDFIFHIASNGKLISFRDGECTLFPSKDQRDWSKFERFWDKSKKEKFDVNTLAHFDKVLVRENARDYWRAVLFSHIDDKTLKAECNCKLWKQCIPYTLKTIHLVGTRNDCPEYYKWWEE